MVTVRRSRGAFQGSFGWGFGHILTAFLPYVAPYACRIGLVDKTFRLLAYDMEGNPRRNACQASQCALCGEFSVPLKQFFLDKEVDQLLGGEICLEKLVRSRSS
jgi:hypothetical protein